MLIPNNNILVTNEKNLIWFMSLQYLYTVYLSDLVYWHISHLEKPIEINQFVHLHLNSSLRTKYLNSSIKAISMNNKYTQWLQITFHVYTSLSLSVQFKNP